MIWECEKCGRHWRYTVEKCIFCEGDVHAIHSEKFSIIGLTEIFVPSEEHERVPYYVLLLEDNYGHKLIKKTFDKYNIGDSLFLSALKYKPKITFGVIGTGTMGIGISHIATMMGFNVILKSRSENSLNKASKKIENWLSKTRNKDEVHEILGNIKFTLDMNLLKDSDIIIENIVEDIKIKKQLFRELGKICSKDTIISSNTSSLSITELSSVVPNPERVVGMHFFNPVQKMHLVEIIRGKDTSEQTVEYVKRLADQLDKTYVVMTDTPGFIVNRILMPLLNEAIRVLEEGNKTAKDVDTAIKLGLNHPMGPLELADLIGLDVCLAIMECLYTGFGDERFKPCLLLKTIVDEGKLGIKTKCGFYEYN